MARMSFVTTRDTERAQPGDVLGIERGGHTDHTDIH